MGVQFFAGKFYKCVDSSGDKFDPSVIANKTHCLSSGYNWTNSRVNFDHVGQGFLALFQVVSIRNKILMQKFFSLWFTPIKKT